MCDLLLDEEDEDALAEDHKTVLLQLLLASVSLCPTADEIHRSSKVCHARCSAAEVAFDSC